jgi:hypothetical protein
MSISYNKAWEEFLEEQGECTPDFEVEFAAAWRACKAEILKILTEGKLSYNETFCSEEAIEKIKEL